MEKAVRDSGIADGVYIVFVPHTTAGVIVNENYDPDVKRDLLATLARLVPASGDCQHGEGNADAHIKTALVGNAVTIPVSGGRLALGTWQGVLFCEFDGPRARYVTVQVMG